MGNDVMAQAEPTVLQTLSHKAVTSANAAGAGGLRTYFDARRVSAPSSIRPYRIDPPTRRQSCIGPSLLTVDARVVVQPGSDPFVTSGDSLPVVHVGPEHRKVVHPCGSQSELRRDHC